MVKFNSVISAGVYLAALTFIDRPLTIEPADAMAGKRNCAVRLLSPFDFGDV
jgi:hypothetical protein